MVENKNDVSLRQAYHVITLADGYVVVEIYLQASESKLKRCDLECSTLRVQIKELVDKLDSTKAAAQSFEGKARILEQEMTHLEQRYQSDFKRFKEADERCKAAEDEVRRETKMSDEARAELVAVQKEKSEVQRVAMERLAQLERNERHIESLERQKADLKEEVDRLHASEKDAILRVAQLEAQVEEREREIESLLKSNNEQRANTVHVLEGLLENERASRAEASRRAEALSLQLQSTQGKLDTLQQELTSVRLNETALDSKLRTASHGKRARVDDYVGMESVQDMDVDVDEHVVRGRKRSRSTTSPLKTHTEDGGSVIRADGDDSRSLQTESEDYTKFTVTKLKQELTKHGFGAEILQLKNPAKKDFVALYEKHVVHK